MGEDSPVSGWCSIPLHQRFCTPLPRPWSQARVVPMGILPHPTRSTALGAVSLWCEFVRIGDSMAATPRLTPDQIAQVSGLVAQYISTQRDKYGSRATPLSVQQKAMAPRVRSASLFSRRTGNAPGQPRRKGSAARDPAPTFLRRWSICTNI